MDAEWAVRIFIQKVDIPILLAEKKLGNYAKNHYFCNLILTCYDQIDSYLL